MRTIKNHKKMKTLDKKYSAKEYIRKNFSEYRGESIFYTRRDLINKFYKILNINLSNGEYTQDQIIYLCLKKANENQCKEILNNTPFIHL